MCISYNGNNSLQDSIAISRLNPFSKNSIVCNKNFSFLAAGVEDSKFDNAGNCVLKSHSKIIKLHYNSALVLNSTFQSLCKHPLVDLILITERYLVESSDYVLYGYDIPKITKLKQSFDGNEMLVEIRNFQTFPAIF